METTNKKNLLIAIVIFLILLIVGALIFSSKQKELHNLQSKPISTSPESAVVSPVPRALMSLQPQTITVEKGKEAVINVMLDAKGEIINGFDTIILFDPQKITVNNIKALSDPANPEFSIVRKLVENDKIIITGVKTKATENPTNIYTFVTLTFVPKTTGTIPLDFELIQLSSKGSTIIRARDNANILDEVTGGSIYVQ
jgi:hypothetical protein